MKRIFAAICRGAYEVVRYGRTLIDFVYSWCMAQRKAVRPAEAAGEGVDWLSADLSHDISAEYAQLFARGLVAAMRSQTVGVREVARRAGISHSTVLGIIDGKNIPDLATIARLEKALMVELLPSPRLRQ